MYKILVTGANGQLGNELKRKAEYYPGFQFTWTDIAELDISSLSAVHDFLKNDPHRLILNCAAYTAVDKAESETQTAFKVNAEAVKVLAEAAVNNKAGFIHISTDFVFDGRKSTPYIEADPVNPLSVYGKSKLEGEKHALKAGIVIRTAWLYSIFGNNFMKTMLRLGKERDEVRVVFDQTGSPTLATDLAEALLQILHKYHQLDSFPVNELYHYSDEGVCSWYDFAREIMLAARLKSKVIPIETAEYPTPAHRPAYSVLNKKKIKETFGLKIPHWTESLHRCMREL